MNVPGPMVITQSTVSLVNHMYVSTYQLMGAKGCGGYTHARLPRISVGYMAQYNLAYENSSSAELLITFYLCYCKCKKEHIIMHVYTPVIGMAHKQAFWLCNVIGIISNNCFR